MDEMVDWRGNTIRRGDLVVYPTNSGSTAYINEGEVVDFIETEDPYKKRPAFKVKLRKIRECGYGLNDYGQVPYRPANGSSFSTIERVERLTKI